MSIKIRAIHSLSTPTSNLMGSVNYDSQTKRAFIRISNSGPDTATNVVLTLTPDPNNHLAIIDLVAPACIQGTLGINSATSAHVASIPSNCYVDCDVQIRTGVTIYGTITTDTMDLGSGSFSGAVNCATEYCQP
jgi:hypothetical protein